MSSTLKTISENLQGVKPAFSSNHTTPVGNALLEALALARITARELRACLWLIRRQLGWQINGERLREAGIPLREWARVLQTDVAHTSSTLSSLAKKRIFIRRFVGPQGKDRGYYYTINTNVTEWSNSCLNKQLLLENANIKLPKTAIFTLPKTAICPDTNIASPKTILNKHKSNNDIEDKSSGEINLSSLAREANELISGQSIERAIRLASGEEDPNMPEKRRAMFQYELQRRGIEWRKGKSNPTN